MYYILSISKCTSTTKGFKRVSSSTPSTRQLHRLAGAARDLFLSFFHTAQISKPTCPVPLLIGKKKSDLVPLIFGRDTPRKSGSDPDITSPDPGRGAVRGAPVSDALLLLATGTTWSWRPAGPDLERELWTPGKISAGAELWTAVCPSPNSLSPGENLAAACGGGAGASRATGGVFSS